MSSSPSSYSDTSTSAAEYTTVLQQDLEPQASPNLISSPVLRARALVLAAEGREVDDRSLPDPLQQKLFSVRLSTHEYDTLLDLIEQEYNLPVPPGIQEFDY